MFGRGKRERAAADEAAREAERHALFAKLAERPEHICPFLGLEGERTGYIDGISDEHRCFAFGDPATLSAEQQTRVCQERGYGNCPRYLRGVLVIPTEELEALRRPRPAAPLAPPPPPKPAPSERRRAPIAALLVLLLLVGAGAAAGYLVLSGSDGVAVNPSPVPTATPTEAPTPTLAPTPTESEAPSPTAEPTQGPSPTPEPTPVAGSTFRFYEVAVAPGSYLLFALNQSGAVEAERGTSFTGYSFAEVEPRQGADGRTYWETTRGGLTGFSYLYPDSGSFGIRAVFFNDAGQRGSVVLPESELDDFPESTPEPVP